MNFDERITMLRKLINNSKKIVFLGGAGVSTESGIPDFRSKNGLYNTHDVKFEKYQPEYLLSHSCLMDNPKVFYEYYRQKLDCRNVEPNITHYKLARLEEIGKISAIITQNIDGLHQKAGSKNVFEIHGTTRKVYCTNCHTNHNPDILFESTEQIPKCKCGGILRPDVTLYEEPLPEEAWINSINALQNADLFIIGGTSLTVYPANTLTQYYHGENCIVINKDETKQDKWAQLVYRESLGEVFSKIDV